MQLLVQIEWIMEKILICLCYCYLMPGKNDDSLKWPFKETIRVSILVEDSELLIKSCYHFIMWYLMQLLRSLDIRNEKGWGYSQFVRLSEIEDFTATKSS